MLLIQLFPWSLGGSRYWEFTVFFKMIKAIVVRYLGEIKIVLASNSNIADFLNNASKKFGDSDISGIMWNGCEVDSETFVAILNEQNLEVEVASLAKNNELSIFVQS
ncbi:uncharacterized protein LOC136087558 [Hydra vulgaris]|uniref:Uncharacterized protein LOC136078361 n=1 Tax=Hydra vulgaris TaxID=6087 RepID=A0ABM4CXQ9_HYDVU